VSRRDGSGLGHLLLGQPDLAEQYMRALSLKGELPSYTGSEIEPSVTLLDLTNPEYLWLRRTTRYQQTKQIGPVGAQFSQIIFAPVANAARVIAVLEKVIFSNSQAATVQNIMWDSITDAITGFAPAAIPKSALDDRAVPFGQLQAGSSFGLIAQTAGAAKIPVTGGAAWLSLPASSSFVLDINAVYTARSVISTPAPLYFIAEAQAVNVALTATFIWRERGMLASESL